MKQLVQSMKSLYKSASLTTDIPSGITTLSAYDSVGILRLKILYEEGKQKLPEVCHYDKNGNRQSFSEARPSQNLKDNRAYMHINGQIVLVNEVIWQLNRLAKGLPFVDGEYNHWLKHEFWNPKSDKYHIHDGEVFGVSAGEVASKIANGRQERFVNKIYKLTGLVVSVPNNSQLINNLSPLINIKKYQWLITANAIIDSPVPHEKHSDSSGFTWYEFTK